MKPSTRNTIIALAGTIIIAALFISRCQRTSPQATVTPEPILSVSPVPTASPSPSASPLPSPTASPAPKKAVQRPKVGMTIAPTPPMEPKQAIAQHPTPTPSPIATPKPKRVPAVLKTPKPTPSPTIAPVSLAATPVPLTPILVTPEMSVPIAIPTPQPTRFAFKLGYWGANNETTTNFWANNSGMVTANFEWKPFNHDLTAGLSLNMMQTPANFSSFIWDWYLRYGILKVGYRSDDLLRSNIPHGPFMFKQDLHAEAIFAGFEFQKPLLGDWLSLDFNLLGGNTFHNVAVGYRERILTDLGVGLNCRLPVRNLEAGVGYRSYVFGTFDDYLKLLSLGNTRSSSFGSYQGPTAELKYRF